MSGQNPAPEPLMPPATGQVTGRRRRGRGRRAEELMVPDATFTSYYGRPVVKAAPWEAAIPLYLFMGGIAGGSSLLGAGAFFLLLDEPEVYGLPPDPQVTTRRLGAVWTAAGLAAGALAAGVAASVAGGRR